MSSQRVAGHQRELLMIQERPRLAQGKSPRGGQGWLEECRLRLVPSGGHVTSGVGRRAPVGHRAPTQERRRRNSAGGEMSTGVSSGRNRKRLRDEVQWWVPGGCSAVRGVCAPCTARRVHGSRASGVHRSAGGEMSTGVSFGRNRKRLRDEVRWWVPGGCSVVRGVRAPCTARRVRGGTCGDVCWYLFFRSCGEATPCLGRCPGEDTCILGYLDPERCLLVKRVVSRVDLQAGGSAWRGPAREKGVLLRFFQNAG